MNQGQPYAQQQQPYPPQQGGGQANDYYQQASQPPPPNGYGNGNGGYNGDSKMALAPNDFQGEKFSPKKPKFNEHVEEQHFGKGD